MPASPARPGVRQPGFYKLPAPRSCAQLHTQSAESRTSIGSILAIICRPWTTSAKAIWFANRITEWGKWFIRGDPPGRLALATTHPFQYMTGSGNRPRPQGSEIWRPFQGLWSGLQKQPATRLTVRSRTRWFQSNPECRRRSTSSQTRPPTREERHGLKLWLVSLSDGAGR